MYMLTIEKPPEGAPIRLPQDGIAEVYRDRLGQFGGPVAEQRDLIVDDDAVVYRPVENVLVPPPWFSGRVVLIGDAAHATSPHCGQGAAQAIEDGLVLTEELQRQETVQAALEAFMARRYDRCKMIVEGSEAIGAWEQDHSLPIDPVQTRDTVTMAAMAPILSWAVGTFDAGAGAFPGIVVDEARVHEVTAVAPTVRALLDRSDEALPHLQQAASRDGGLALDELEVLAPIEPRQILQAGADAASTCSTSSSPSGARKGSTRRRRSRRGGGSWTRGSSAASRTSSSAPSARSAALRRRAHAAARATARTGSSSLCGASARAAPSRATRSRTTSRHATSSTART